MARKKKNQRNDERMEANNSGPNTRSRNNRSSLIDSTNFPPQPNNDDNQSERSGYNMSADTVSVNETTEKSSKSKPKIQVFKGSNDKITIENWFKRFEMLNKFYNWSENKQIIMLGNYLEDDALNWYIENYDNDSYLELKTKLISRFGLETNEPIIEFVNLKYDVKTGIKEYFESKRRLGIAAKLTVEQIIPLMIHNLHPKMTDYFTAVKPKTFADFYSIAKTAENNFKRNFNYIQKSNNFDKNKTKISQNSNNEKPKRKPPNPCMICEKLGFKGRYHWANDCRNKSKNQNNNISNSQNKTINTLSNNSNNSESIENDINQINLN